MASTNQSVFLVDLARHYGGVDVRVLDTARALHGRTPYAVATLDGSPIHQRLAAASLNAWPLPYCRSDPRHLLALMRAIKRRGFTVVDSHNVQSQLWGSLAATLARVPTRIATVHTAYGITPGGVKGWLHEQVLRLNKAWGCRFITVSHSIYNYLRGLGIPAERLTLSYNGIHFSDNGSAADRNATRASFGWGPDEFVVVSVGRLDRQKGHDFLLEAMAQAIGRRPQLRCLIVGEGPFRPVLEEITKRLQLHHVARFAGFRQDVPVILHASDAFCMPSRAEGLPYALLEATAHQLPLLVSRVDGMGELLTHNRTALLLPVGDVAALADGLCWLADYPQEAAALGRAAHALVRQRLDPGRMVAETLTAYGLS